MKKGSQALVSSQSGQLTHSQKKPPLLPCPTGYAPPLHQKAPSYNNVFGFDSFGNQLLPKQNFSMIPMSSSHYTVVQYLHFLGFNQFGNPVYQPYQMQMPVMQGCYPMPPQTLPLPFTYQPKQPLLPHASSSSSSSVRSFLESSHNSGHNKGTSLPQITEEDDDNLNPSRADLEVQAIMASNPRDPETGRYIYNKQKDCYILPPKESLYENFLRTYSQKTRDYWINTLSKVLKNRHFK